MLYKNALITIFLAVLGCERRIQYGEEHEEVGQQGQIKC